MSDETNESIGDEAEPASISEPGELFEGSIEPPALSAVEGPVVTSAISVESSTVEPSPVEPPVVPVVSPVEPPDPEYSREQRRDVRAVHGVLNCPHRKHAVLTLAMAGRVCVGDLARRSGIEQKALSRYLKDLWTAGLVEDQREGRFVFYQVVPGVVRFERNGNRFSLTIHRGTVSITHAAEFLPRPKPKPEPQPSPEPLPASATLPTETEAA